MKAPKSRPRLPTDIAPCDSRMVAAVKACFAGKANPSQIQRVLGWIIVDVCEVGREQFYSGPDGQRLTDFALGKRRVALELVRVRDIKLVVREQGGDIPTAKEPDDPIEEPSDAA
jgi:hypothetical protein